MSVHLESVSQDGAGRVASDDLECVKSIEAGWAEETKPNTPGGLVIFNPISNRPVPAGSANRQRSIKYHFRPQVIRPQSILRRRKAVDQRTHVLGGQFKDPLMNVYHSHWYTPLAGSAHGLDGEGPVNPHLHVLGTFLHPEHIHSAFNASWLVGFPLSDLRSAQSDRSWPSSNSNSFTSSRSTSLPAARFEAMRSALAAT